MTHAASCSESDSQTASATVAVGLEASPTDAEPSVGQWLHQRSAAGADRQGAVQIDGLLAAADRRGSRDRAYRLRLPAGYRADQPAALWTILHGCHQTHRDIQTISAFERYADAAQAILLYPFVTSYTEYRQAHCWGWWLDAHRRRGAGEPGDLRRLAEAVEKDYPIDARRRYIGGLSSGAAMAVVCLVVDADYWCGGASVGGVVFGESARAVRLSQALPVRHRPVVNLVAGMRRAMPTRALPPLLIVHTTEDARVPLQCAHDMRDCWLRMAREQGVSRHRRQAGHYNVQHWVYDEWRSAAGDPHLASCVLDSNLHGWSGGRAGHYSDPDGPNLSCLIAGWFGRMSMG